VAAGHSGYIIPVARKHAARAFLLLRQPRAQQARKRQEKDTMKEPESPRRVRLGAIWERKWRKWDILLF
jgi:hypothetical protein